MASANNNNNNTPNKNFGASSTPFGNAAGMAAGGAAGSSVPGKQPMFGQPQMNGGGFQNQQFQQLSQAQAIAQAQSKAQAAHAAHAAAQAQAQAQAAHAQFQAQLQAQGMTLNSSQNAGISLSGANAANAAKRFPQKPPARPQGPASTFNTASPLKTMELTPAAARLKKKQKSSEKELQDRVAAILPESALYTQLLEFESRVDTALLRKKVDIQEALKNPPCIQKTLRIYVFNTFANQTQANVPRDPNGEPPSWTLKIIGRILEDGTDNPDQQKSSAAAYPKFSTFFKRVTITLDQRLYPDNHMIIWENARSPAPHEGFEVKRKGDKEFTANIRFEMNYMPEKYKLSPALTDVLGIEVDTRPRIIAAIWHYVKARKLQNPNDPSYFNCDLPLQKVFGEEKMKFTMVSLKISQHLSPPQPIHLEHRIKLSGTSAVGNACYDVMIDVPFPIQRELSTVLANTEKNKEIDACDEAITNAIKKIHEHRKRRAFFLGFSQSPVEFINALIESQSRDLKLAAGESSRNAEKERRSEFFNQPWVEDAVIRYLNRKPVTGVDVAGST